MACINQNRFATESFYKLIDWSQWTCWTVRTRHDGLAEIMVGMWKPFFEKTPSLPRQIFWKNTLRNALTHLAGKYYPSAFQNIEIFWKSPNSPRDISIWKLVNFGKSGIWGSLCHIWCQNPPKRVRNQSDDVTKKKSRGLLYLRDWVASKFWYGASWRKMTWWKKYKNFWFSFFHENVCGIRSRY